jgi:hypothetical protein
MRVYNHNALPLASTLSLIKSALVYEPGPGLKENGKQIGRVKGGRRQVLD